MTVDTLSIADEQALARLKWRKQLPEMVVRELASEYLIMAGKDQQYEVLDTMLVDAWKEYQERYAEADRISSLGIRKNKKAPRRRKQRSNQ